MANYDKQIYDLGQVQNALNSNLEKLTERGQQDTLSWFSVGTSYYRDYFDQVKKVNKKEILWNPILTEDPSVNSKNFQQKLTSSEIQTIINFYEWLSRQQEETSAKPVKETSSVPPEVEAMVEEYRQNQDRLNEEEIASKAHRTVAEQVKIAFSHAKIRERVLANRLEREKAGEKFRDSNQTIVDLASPKDKTIEAVLAPSYKAVERTAYAYSGFFTLSPEIQKQIIDKAVELNTIGITDINVAIQTASLQLGVSYLSSSFVSEVAEELDNIDLQTKELEDKLSQNESAIDTLRAKAILTESEQQQLNRLLQENSSLTSNLETTNTRHLEFADSRSERFAKYNSEIDDRQKKDQDLQELSAAANNKISSIHNTLLQRGVTPRIPSDLDKMNQLVAALQKDIPGINQSASYEGAFSAATIGGSQGMVILAYSRGVTGAVLRQAERFAAANPNSATAKFLNNNQKVFQAARRSIRQLESSKLGSDILQTVSRGYQVIGIVTNPVGALKSWAGKKAGEQFRQRISEKIGNVVLKNASEVLLKEGFKDGVKTLASQATAKMVAKAATWAALKLGISLSAETLNAILPGLGVIVDIVLQVIIWVIEKTIGAAYNGFQNLMVNVYGEKLKARDIIAPIVIFGGAIAAASAFFRGVTFFGRTLQIAAVSAVGIIIAMGIYTVFVFLTAPMLSTLVQLDSVEKVKYEEYGAIAQPSSDCAWPTKGHYAVTTGPRGGTHSLSQLEAIDLYSSSINGTPLLSATSGQVTYTGPYSNYGNTVKIQTKNSAGSFTVIYGHLSAISVGKGQQVSQGQKLGLVGGSGGWDPHIHMEYVGIKYNQCPAGGLKIKEQCCAYTGTNCHGLCNAFSN